MTWLELRPETRQVLQDAIDRCDKASEYLTSGVAHDKQCYIDEMQNADRRLCQLVKMFLDGAL